MVGSSRSRKAANLFKLTKDARGRWRRQNLGQKQGGDGQLGSATFFLGTDYEEACKRVAVTKMKVKSFTYEKNWTGKYYRQRFSPACRAWTGISQAC